MVEVGQKVAWTVWGVKYKGTVTKRFNENRGRIGNGHLYYEGDLVINCTDTVQPVIVNENLVEVLNS